MSGSPAWLLQTAMLSRLTADATLAALIGTESVYDETPDGTTTFPYVVIGDVTEAPYDAMGRTGRDLTVTVHIWSQAKGFKQVHNIQSRLDELLDRWAPSLSGWYATQMQQEFFETFRDPDGITRRGDSRYRIHTHQ